MSLKPKPALWDELNIGGCLYWDDEAVFLADTLNIVQPKNILETGFFAGASAFMWLYLSNAKVTSVDPMVNLYDPKEVHTGRIENVDKLKAAFPNRFSFIQKDSRLIRDDIRGQKFDLFFIDGDHLESGIINDFSIALEMGIEWVLVDDFVTSVESVYNQHFKNYYLPPIRVYPRKAQFQGKPIPMTLLRLADGNIFSKVINSGS